LREIAAGFVNADFLKEREKMRQADALLNATDMLAQAAAQASVATVSIEVEADLD